jgi:hypothetical protein
MTVIADSSRVIVNLLDARSKGLFLRSFGLMTNAGRQMTDRMADDGSVGIIHYHISDTIIYKL